MWSFEWIQALLLAVYSHRRLLLVSSSSSWTEKKVYIILLHICYTNVPSAICLLWTQVPHPPHRHHLPQRETGVIVISVTPSDEYLWRTAENPPPLFVPEGPGANSSSLGLSTCASGFAALRASSSSNSLCCLLFSRGGIISLNTSKESVCFPSVSWRWDTTEIEQRHDSQVLEMR